jgi:hypothetical protein
VKINRTLSELPVELAGPMTVILAIATDGDVQELKELTEEVQAAVNTAGFPCEVRFYNLTKLESELLGN